MTTVTDFVGRVRAQVRVELDRAWRMRTIWVLAGSMLAVAGLVACGASDRAEALKGVAALRVFVVLLGVLSVTSEHEYGDVVWRYLIEPCRAVHVAAKAATNALIGALLGAAALAIGVAVTMVRLGAPAGAGPLTAASGAVVGVALAGVLGVGVGAAVRNQTAAVVGTLVGVLLVEPLLAAVAPAAGPYLPGAAAAALAGGAMGAAWVAAVLASVAYAAGAAIVGGAICARSDV